MNLISLWCLWNTMPTLLVLCLLFSLGLSQSIPKEYKEHENFKLVYMGNNCGYSSVNRIIGGKHAAVGQYPWIVRIGYTHDPEDSQGVVESYECGGSIISDIYVLTAAHCSPEVVNMQWVEIRAGEHDTLKDKDCDKKGVCAPPVQDILIQDYFCHKDFHSTLQHYHNDICIIRLESKIKFNVYVQPICLPFYNEIIDEDLSGRTVEVAGWGIKDSAKNETSEILLTLNVPITDQDDCINAYSILDKDIVPDQICAGGEKSKDSCKGDSGGPLMTSFSVEGPPRYFLIGIVSYGPEPCGDEKGIPGVYTAVTQYLEWILKHLPTGQ